MKEARRFSKVMESGNGIQDRCDACDRTASQAGCANGKLKRCGRCKVTMYCSAACSSKGWKEGKHKAVCFKAVDG